MLLLIALSSFLAAAFAVVALARRPQDPLEARVRLLAGETVPALEAADPLIRGRRISPLAREGIRLLHGVLPSRLFDRLVGALRAAGEPVDPGLFLLWWTLIVVGAGALGALFAGPRGLLFAAALGFLLPLLWLRRASRGRRLRISRALPDAIDLLVACVEAGLGLDAALVRVGDATDGPLGDEIRRTLLEISVGRPRQEALLDLAARSHVADLNGFLRPIVQAERIGVSIGTALRVQAEGLRERRRQRAREVAEKLPAKMVIPMLGFFLPAVLIVGISPAVFLIADTLSKAGL